MNVAFRLGSWNQTASWYLFPPIWKQTLELALCSLVFQLGPCNFLWMCIEGFCWSRIWAITRKQTWLSSLICHCRLISPRNTAMHHKDIYPFQTFKKPIHLSFVSQKPIWSTNIGFNNITSKQLIALLCAWIFISRDPCADSHFPKMEITSSLLFLFKKKRWKVR